MDEMASAAGRIPLIGDKAPDFRAKTTDGWLTLSEYGRGSWVLLFSHPADFTPVCTTEMSGFARQKAEFDALNTKLLGLSIDSVYAHLGWIQNVKERTGVQFNFPIIADINMHVSRLYGMLHPGVASVATVRAVYFIDPNMTVRLIMYYPLNVGRSMHEILRALKALQLTDAQEVSTPLDWEPGGAVCAHAPETLEGVNARMENREDGLVDFYLLMRKG